jgi:hypothetical protein
MVEGWTTRTAVGANANVPISADRTFQMIPSLRLALWWWRGGLWRIEARATAVGAATMFSREALVIGIKNSVYDGSGSLCWRLHEVGSRGHR